MSTATADPRGLKRVCVECGIRFYDMNKRPIMCPNCNTEYTGAVIAKAKRTKLEPETVKPVTEIESADDETETDGDISLDEAAELENQDEDDSDDEGMDLDALNVNNLDDEDLDDLDAVEEDDD